MSTNDNININSVDAVFGDARLTLYRIHIQMPEPKAQHLTPGSTFYHRHNYYELHTITSGCASLRVGGRDIPVLCGGMLIIPPHTEHCPYVPAGSGDREIVLSMTLEQTDGDDGFFAYFSESLRAAACQPLALPAELLHRIGSFAGLLESTRLRDRCILKMTAYEILVQLFDQINGFSTDNGCQLTRRKSLSDRENLTLLLEELIHTPHSTLKSIADSLGYSTRHTARLIRQTYGKTLNELRRELLITHAKRIREESPELPISAIAERIGYADVQALRRALKKPDSDNPKENEVSV